MWQTLEAASEWIVTGLAFLIVIVKGLAVWLVPLAIVIYVVTYFVMAISLVILWKNGREPTIPSFRQRWAKGSSSVR
jgi:amino acid transporter